ncbi:Uncharacterized protein TCM_039356 [Theobroma cacao]|uniref:Uncharacterized protein n=1 Tax=Theobroma cacao TaxID=3641 RepID=A0A061GQ48_THECC|nr:Uncharacterized protein TCM_039356 [Theobroma cacao]
MLSLTTLVRTPISNTAIGSNSMLQARDKKLSLRLSTLTHPDQQILLHPFRGRWAVVNAMKVWSIWEKICKDCLKDLLTDECNKAKMNTDGPDVDLLLMKALPHKYNEELSTQLEFDPKAWTGAIRGPNNIRTHIYEFGTRVPTLRLLALTITFEFACGLDTARPSLPLISKPEGYRQLVGNISTLMTSMSRINNLLEVITTRFLSLNVFGSSSSQ